MPTPDELRQRLSGQSATSPQALRERLSPPPDISGLESFTRGAATQFLGNILGTPEAISGAIPAQEMSPRMQERLGPFAESLRRSQNEGFIRMPTGQEAVAGLQAAVPGPQGSIPDRFSAAMQRGQQAVEQNPGISGAGEVAGDVATLLTGRAPFAKSLARPSTATRAQTMEPGVRRAFERVLRSQPMQKLFRGAGRAAETGAEAAILQSLNQGDPLEAALFASAGQMAGSGALELSKGLLSGGVGKAGLKLGVAAFAAGSILQLLKEVTPGGRNFLLESVETGYEKVALTLALGAAAGLVGAGRVRGTQFAEDFPKLADALSAVPRGTVLSLVNGALRDETGSTESAMEKLARNPEVFNSSQRRQLERGLNRGDFTSVVERLASEDPQFEAILDAPSGLEGVPVREEDQ